MIITKKPEYIPARRFACTICGAEFIAAADEALTQDYSWITSCPCCGSICYAYETDQLSREEMLEVLNEHGRISYAALKAVKRNG